MEKILKAVQTDPDVQRISKLLADKSTTRFAVTGISGTSKSVVTASIYQNSQLAIITQDQNHAVEWKNDLENLLPNVEILELPEIDLADLNATTRGLEISARRMEILSKLSAGKSLIVIAKISSAVQKNISRKKFESMSLKLELNKKFSRDDLLEKLTGLGYENTIEVNKVGEFSTRGGIIDVFPINATLPIRIELFDDEIESIRQFDLGTKRSIKNLDSAIIFPLEQRDSREVSFLDFFDKTATVIFDEPIHLRESIHALNRESGEFKNSRLEFDDLLETFRGKKILMSLMTTRNSEIKNEIHISAMDMTPFQNQLDLFADEIKLWNDRKIFLVIPTFEKIESTKKILTRSEIDISRLEFIQGYLRTGFELPRAKISVVTEKDIFGHSKRKISRRIRGEKISSFSEIRAGDYVVHSTHGIGKYLGVETLEVKGLHKDYLKIQFAGTDRIFVPPEQISTLQKYLGGDGKVPKLSKIGGSDWLRAKSKAQSAVQEIAGDLLRIYAQRETAIGFAFSPDNDLQREFENAFPFEETPDQLQAVAEIKHDMENSKPMDRLLIGDVGFGKTEVAMRAAYKAVLDGKQVAVLVPTTVLAQQHFQTFTERFKNFLPVVEMISRFRTQREQKDILERVADGSVDILIGTHGVLNTSRVKFHDLGLLILDEEHRFGVKHKEMFKEVESKIDVLTLSATPIPRTLNMSLVGARDMSVIETPPVERYPVQTYVIENDDSILQTAIRRELSRGGQVFFIYTRIDTIDKIRDHIAHLVPEARIQTAHGQMNENLLEQVMLDFYNGRFDILLATSIIENGLDVANANTIIIYNADRFGLSQLYQMRGRVGRSNRMAFAYFVYQSNKVLSEDAEKRLETMKDFAQLGAGFKIAMRDLEIRGAGNILGAQQHGHIASVGYATYCQMLEAAIENLKNQSQDSKNDSEENFEIFEAKIPNDVQISLNVDAYIGGDYIDDDAHKFEIYQRLSNITTEEQLRDLTDEMIDRFGTPSLSVENLLKIVRIKILARKFATESITEKKSLIDNGGMIEFRFKDRESVPLQGIFSLQKIFKQDFQMVAKENLFRVKFLPAERKNLLSKIEKILIMLNV